ncbi:MAG: hypothetical protein ACI9MC_001991 [Kiritimatiellia bacterium]
MEFFGPALILFVILVMPISVVVGGALTWSVTRQFFNLQGKRLELLKWEMEQRIEIDRLSIDLPPWVDRTDPMEIQAWRSAIQETLSAGDVKLLGH